MKFVVVWLEGDSLAQAIRCRPLVASTISNPSKLRQSTDVTRIAVEHLPDQPFGFPQGSAFGAGCRLRH
jgi:hypothetical protein